MQLNVNDYESMTGKKPAPLYSNNVLLVCGAGEAWEYYKNVIVFVASGDGQNCHRLWLAFNYQFKSSSVPMGRWYFRVQILDAIYTV